MQSKKEKLKKLFPQGKVNINGEIFNPEEAQISIFDRGFLYGDSVYETFPAYNKKPLFLDDHIERLWNSAALLSLELSYSKEEIIKEMNKIIQATGLDDIYLRIIITRGESSIGLISDDPENNLIIIAKDLPVNPDWWYEKGVSVYITGILRNDPKATNSNSKSENYLNNIMAHMDARKHNFYDAVMANKEGHITEGTTNNTWMVKDNTIYTPPLTAGLLRGITREKVLEAIKSKTQYQVKEANFTTQEFLNADEAFLTSSLRGVVPITQINQNVLGKGPGKITRDLIEKYQELVDEYLKM